MNAMQPRRSRWLTLVSVAAVSVMVPLAATPGATAAADDRGDDGWVQPGEPYESLHAAVGAGALDGVLAERLARGEPVEALAVLDGREVLEAYGEGDRRQVSEARDALARLRAGVLEEAPGVETLQAYDIAPVLYVHVATERAALRLLNTSKVLSLLLDEEHVHWQAQSLPLVTQPAVAARGTPGPGRASP